MMLTSLLLNKRIVRIVMNVWNVINTISVVSCVYCNCDFITDVVFLILLYSVPSAAPQNVRGNYTSSTSILVTWGEVPADKKHGNIRQYTVFYKESTGEGLEALRKIVSLTRQIELTQLEKYMEYSIQVSAATIKGDGPRSARSYQCQDGPGR